VANDSHGTERRQHQRVSAPFEGHWDGVSGSNRCRIGDVSLGGCFVQTLALPKMGEKTTVTIAIEGQEFALPGRVIATEAGQGFSIQFDADAVNGMAEFKRVVENLIAKRSARP